ncbi:MAG: hypothetical protein QRY74_05260 [Chlamydia sp.]
MIKSRKIARDRVEKLVYSGDGLIRSMSDSGTNQVTFVPYVLPEELIEYEITESKKNYSRGSLVTLLTPSLDRVLPRCIHFRECGGCQLQHIAPVTQAKIKQQWLQDMVDYVTGEKSSCIVSWRHFGDDSWYWRRKITLHLFFSHAEWHLGYYKASCHSGKSPSLFSLQECPIFFTQEENPILEDVRRVLKTLFPKPISTTMRGDVSFVRALHSHENGIPVSSLFSIHLFFEDVANPNGCSSEDRDLLFQQIAYEFGLCAWADQISCDLFGKRKQLKGDGKSLFQIGHRSIRVPNHIFSQNHPTLSHLVQQQVAQSMYEKMQKILNSSEEALEVAFIDLYSGVGSVLMLLDEIVLENDRKRCAGLHLVEQSHPACAIFEKMAKQFASLPTYTYPMSAEKALNNAYSLLGKRLSRSTIEPIWSVNPPRSGLSQEVRGKLITGDFGLWGIYTSCHLATLQRDLSDFIAHGWRIQEARGYDLFPMTTHFEGVVIIEKQPPKA